MEIGSFNFIEFQSINMIFCSQASRWIPRNSDGDEELILIDHPPPRTLRAIFPLMTLMKNAFVV